MFTKKDQNITKMLTKRGFTFLDKYKNNFTSQFAREHTKMFYQTNYTR